MPHYKFQAQNANSVGHPGKASAVLHKALAMSAMICFNKAKFLSAVIQVGCNALYSVQGRSILPWIASYHCGLQQLLSVLQYAC